MSDLPFLISLPTTDRKTAFEFYGAGMGFRAEGEPDENGIPEPLQFALNENARIMLVPTVGFDWITGDRQPAPAGVSECMLLLAQDSDEDVDATIERARRAGAEIVTEPGEQRWGYAAAFADLDGHLWMVRTGWQTAE